MPQASEIVDRAKSKRSAQPASLNEWSANASKEKARLVPGFSRAFDF
jgi:hypothetical protein